jgi:folate-binding Fe-S cluster repair protein YgfZ
VVARIHYRGKVNHRPCGLRLDGSTLPPARTPVELDGRELGLSGTAVHSPTLAHPLALAILHRNAEPGARVHVAGIPARVLDLPFVGR